MALPALFRSFLVVFLSLLLSIVRADDAPDIGAPGKPVKVEVGVFMVDLIEVDGASQTFRGDFLLRLRWQDPRLAAPGKELRRFSKQDVWFPKALVTNLRESDLRWPEEVTVDESGAVTYLQRSIGTFACPLDLRKFPHDEQELFVQVLGVGVTPEDLVFEIDKSICGTAEGFTLTDWEAGEFALSTGNETIPALGLEVPGFRLTFKVKRLSNYYVGTIFATVAIIALMAWLVYWLPIGALPPRISVSVTSMLALIAYRFVAAQDLPKLPYLTSMDHFLLGAALLILIGLATVVVVANQDAKGRHELAKRLNLWFRWAYPVGLIALLITRGRG